MRFTSKTLQKAIKKTILIVSTFSIMVTITGCGNVAYDYSYDINNELCLLRSDSINHAVYDKTFAEKLCVVTEDFSGTNRIDTSKDEAAVLYDVSNKDILYSKNAHERLHPASLTKIMTALVAIKYGSLEQSITATDSVKINEKGAQLCGVAPGDVMTLDQAIHILLLYSANDIAMFIAEGVGGSVDHFIDMMNEEARSLGATNTHFVNPHGLTNEEHYTTAYDLYLIMNEVKNYDFFREVISSPTYQTEYMDNKGQIKKIDYKTTNLYVRGERNAPEGITIIGGKTGTTAAAGHCLILLANDASDKEYISIILKSESGDSLYTDMTNLLSEIQK